MGGLGTGTGTARPQQMRKANNAKGQWEKIIAIFVVYIYIKREGEKMIFFIILELSLSHYDFKREKTNLQNKNNHCVVGLVSKFIIF